MPEEFLLTVDNGFNRYADYYTEDVTKLTQKIGRKRAREHLGTPKRFYGDEVERAYTENKRADPNYWMAGGMVFGAEALWHQNERPYYRIHPDYAAIFAKTQLDVPVQFVKAPYTAFAMEFVHGKEPNYDSRIVLSALFSYGRNNDLLRSLDVDGDASLSPEEYEQGGMTDSTMILLLITRDAITGRLRKQTCIMRLGNDPDLLLGEKLKELETTNALDTGSPIHDKELTYRMFSIAASVCFLATGGDKLVEPDVLNPDFRTYLDAVNRKDWATATALSQKAKRVRNGQPGFVVGREESLLGRRAVNRSDEEIGEGTELRHQHQRKGHFHKYWTGTNRDQLTVKWISQLTVRPDLPLNPADRIGARTLDSKATENRLNTE